MDVWFSGLGMRRVDSLHIARCLPSFDLLLQASWAGPVPIPTRSTTLRNRRQTHQRIHKTGSTNSRTVDSNCCGSRSNYKFTRSSSQTNNSATSGTGNFGAPLEHGDTVTHDPTNVVRKP